LAVVPCPKCGTRVYTLHHSAAGQPRPAFWKLDTREVAVKCPECKHIFGAFAYPLFNWIPIRRAVTFAAAFNLLVVILLLTLTW